MILKDRITDEVLDHGDRARVESEDMRCLCETLAICFQALLDKLDEMKQSIDSIDYDPVKIWGTDKK